MAKLLLMTNPGIRYYSALLIICDIGDINCFPDSYHLCSYAGLLPSTHSLGGFTYHGKITKTGSKDKCLSQYYPPVDYNTTA